MCHTKLTVDVGDIESARKLAVKLKENKDLSLSEHNQIKYGTFKKSFYIPEDANTDKIDAKMQNGVLFITIHKLEKIPENI